MNLKRILSIFVLIGTMLSLAGCKNGSDVPDGMQLVRGGEDVGYYFYAPEEWTVSNLGDISAAYASRVDPSSISYTECEMPECTIEEYIDKSLLEFSFKVTPLYDIEDTTFGNADRAVSFVYEYDYDTVRYRTKQIFASYGERFGIFTFTSRTDNMSSSELSQYDYYKDKIQSVIDNFKYVDISISSPSEKPSYEGYALVSDPSVSNFSLYLTDDFTVDYSSGIVSATLSDGSNLTLSRVTGAGVDVGTYLDTRLDELGAIVSDLTVIEFEDENGEMKKINGAANLGNARAAASLEYTFVYNNVEYHVYQVCAVTVFDGFVFTYTAKEENYEKHLDLIMEIAEKVEF